MLSFLISAELPLLTRGVLYIVLPTVCLLGLLYLALVPNTLIVGLLVTIRLIVSFEPRNG